MDSLRGHLVDVCRQARDDAGASKTKIAAAINKGEQSVSRFEQGVGGWHNQTGELVNAYAEVSGVPPWELWQMAIDLWRQSQEVPTSSRGSRRSAKVQTPQDTETRLDIEELRDKLNKRLGSGRSESPKVSDPSPEDQAPKRDRQRPPHRRQASDSA